LDDWVSLSKPNTSTEFDKQTCRSAQREESKESKKKKKKKKRKNQRGKIETKCQRLRTKNNPQNTHQKTKNHQPPL
jgi:hypothetical protein